MLRVLFLALSIGPAGLTGLVAGCAVRPHGAPATCPITEFDWPSRITDGLPELAAKTPGILFDVRDGDSPPPKAARDDGHRSVIRIVRAEARELGIVLELDRLAPHARGPTPDETELAFVSFSPLARDGNGVSPQQSRLPAKISWNDVRAGVQWRLYEPGIPHARGLIVHLGGNKYVRRALLKRGWVVLHSSGTGRYHQRRASPQTFKIGGGEDIVAVASRIAAVFDDELADWPYALEAVLEHLAHRRPDIPQRPAAIMGFSIGALGLPAVVARMPDRFEAAVIVAGGANLLEIARRSRKPNRGIDLEWTGATAGPEGWYRLRDAYLQRAKLDPYHAAAVLSGTPVLMVHALFDQVVPARAGNLLFARLGKPERLIYPVGHGHLLRIVMRLQADRIVTWTEAALSDQPARKSPAHRR